MKKKIGILVFVLIFSFSLSGCSKDSSIGSTSGLSFLKNKEDMFTERDYEVDYDEEKSIKISLNGSAASCDSDKVEIDGRTVKIIEDGTFVLTGTLNDGMIIVDVEDSDKPQLVLDNASVTSKTSAALYVLEADKVFVTTAEGSNNSLKNGGNFTAIDANNIDGAVYTKQDVVFNGKGSLIVTSPAGHGIAAKDDVKFTSGTYTINAAFHGVDANDSIRVADGTFDIDAGKDGFHAENTDDESLGYIYIIGGTFEIEAEGDGISAGTTLQSESCIFSIITGGGSGNAEIKTSESYGEFMGGKPSKGGRGGTTDPFAGSSSNSSTEASEDEGSSIKGIKSAGNMYLDEVDVKISSADDGIHSNASIVVKSGTFNISTGDDGFHADETLSMMGGEINVTKSYEGLEGLNIEISGGSYRLVSSDDGINAAGGSDSSGKGGARGDEQFGKGGPGESSASGGSILISGGEIYMKASGDGIDSNGTLDITGGFIQVCGPTNGDTAVLDYESAGTINGGTFVGTGAYMMAQTLSSTEQGVIAVSVGSQSAGTTITITDKNGKKVDSFVPELSYQIMIYSSPEIVKGEAYTLNVGSLSGTIEAS